MNQFVNAGKAITSSQIKDRKKAIPYRPQYNLITKNVAASILLQQLWYWWDKMGHQDFYKYRKPCANSKPKDSWTEELGFTDYQFDKAIKTLGQKVTSGNSKTDAYNQSLVIWWTDSNRRTWYRLNEKNFFYLVGLAYMAPDELNDKDLAQLLGNCDGRNYLDNFEGQNNLDNHEGDNFLYSENTTETTQETTNTPPASPAAPQSEEYDDPWDHPVTSLGKKTYTEEDWLIEEDKVLEEPIYVDEPFGDDDNSGRKRPNWMIPKEDDTLVLVAFEATSGNQPRKYFPTKRSRTRWNMIKKSCLPLADGESKYPLEWAESCIGWARKSNNRYRRSKPMVTGVKITFESLLSAIENESRCQDFISKLEQQPVA